MNPEWSEDLWRVTRKTLLEYIRALALDEVLTEDIPKRVLQGALLATADDQLTPAGRELYLAQWVRKDNASSRRLLADALRPALAFQVLQQELQGYGPIREDGAMHLLHLHRAVPPGVDDSDLRRLLNLGSELGLLVYSKKNKTLRAALPPTDSAAVGDDPRLTAVVSPRTPMLNVVRLRQILRASKGVVWWADPHLSRRCLEDLIEELDFQEVQEVRLLSGTDTGVLSDKAKADFSRFRVEVELKGAKTEWRADSNRDWHDRYLGDDRVVYNMPPANTLYKGDYSEMQPAVAKPPLDTWWSRSSLAWS